MRYVLTLPFLIAANPVFAASGPFFSLRNTDFIVTLAFLVFVGVLFYLKVPGQIAAMLDARSVAIRKEMDDAKILRDEAQAVWVLFERKQAEAKEQVSRIVADAQAEAQIAADKAREDIAVSVERRIAAAEDQIASAHEKAVKDVRDRAVMVAVAAVQELLSKQMTAAKSGNLIKEGIAEVNAKLH